MPAPSPFCRPCIPNPPASDSYAKPMPPFRLCRLLLVAALVASASFAAAPASGQSGKIDVYVVRNDMTDDLASKEKWQMQVTVRPVEGCTPTKADLDYSSGWVSSKSDIGFALSIGECDFKIHVVFRLVSDTVVDCWHTSQLSWQPAGGSQPADNHVFASQQPDGAVRISAVRKPGSICTPPAETRFFFNPSDVVENLHQLSANSDFRALAVRAVELAAFEVGVTPDASSGRVTAGCDQSARVSLLGGSQGVRHSLKASGGPCTFKAAITSASPLFEVPEGRSVTFSDGVYQAVDLTSLVSLPQARIVIVQDVLGSNNQGTASYTIARSCGGRSVQSPDASVASVSLQEGRFTVHAPSAPAFGATATYPAVAAALDSDRIVDCSVTVSLPRLSPECVVDGEPTQTLTWTVTNPIRNFDFEFDIRCGAARYGAEPSDADLGTLPAAEPTDADDTNADDVTGMVELAEPAGEADPPSAEPRDGPALDMPTG